MIVGAPFRHRDSENDQNREGEIDAAFYRIRMRGSHRKHDPEAADQKQGTE
jgi:hypothetical protein